nr:hypothetical protein [Tanacetum cinerariifolium]
VGSVSETNEEVIQAAFVFFRAVVIYNSASPPGGIGYTVVTLMHLHEGIPGSWSLHDVDDDDAESGYTESDDDDAEPDDPESDDDETTSGGGTHLIWRMHDLTYKAVLDNTS